MVDGEIPWPRDLIGWDLSALVRCCDLIGWKLIRCDLSAWMRRWDLIGGWEGGVCGGVDSPSPQVGSDWPGGALRAL